MDAGHWVQPTVAHTRGPMEATRFAQDKTQDNAQTELVRLRRGQGPTRASDRRYKGMAAVTWERLVVRRQRHGLVLIRPGVSPALAFRERGYEDSNPLLERI